MPKRHIHKPRLRNTYGSVAWGTAWMISQPGSVELWCRTIRADGLFRVPDDVTLDDVTPATALLELGRSFDARDDRGLTVRTSVRSVGELELEVRGRHMGIELTDDGRPSSDSDPKVELGNLSADVDFVTIWKVCIGKLTFPESGNGITKGSIGLRTHFLIFRKVQNKNFATFMPKFCIFWGSSVRI